MSVHFDDENSGSSEQKKQKEGKDAKEHRERVDRTSELEPGDRRLDSLAYLLAFKSTCVSASIIEGTLYVSSNEIYKKEGNPSKKEQAILEVLNYFGRIARGKKLNEERRQQKQKEMFKQLCSEKRLSDWVKGSPLLFSVKLKDLVKAIAEEYWENRSTERTLTEHLRNSKYKDDYVAVGAAYGQWFRVYTHFLKLEEALVNAQQGKYPEKSSTEDQATIAELFTALKTFQLDSSGGVVPGSKVVILKEQEKPQCDEGEVQQVVHAEMKMLAKILSLVKAGKIKVGGSVYIGISKLCCAQCYCTLEAAMEVLEKKGITLEVRGEHGRDFEENWAFPVKLSKSKEGSIFYEVYELSNKKISTKLSKHPHQGSMEASLSQSPIREEGPKKTINVELLTERLRFLNSLKESLSPEMQKGLDESIQLVSLAIKLHSFHSFKSVLAIGSESAFSLRPLKAVLAELQTTTSEPPDLALILKILQNKDLVGQEVAENFKKRSKEELEASLKPKTQKGGIPRKQQSLLVSLPSLPASSSSSSSSSSSFLPEPGRELVSPSLLVSYERQRTSSSSKFSESSEGRLIGQQKSLSGSSKKAATAKRKHSEKEEDGAQPLESPTSGKQPKIQS